MYELISAHDIDGFGEHLADDFVEHEDLPAGGPNREGVMAFFRMQIAGFPDMAMTVEDVVDGGDKVVARGRFTGTHTGPFMGMPPTGRRVDVGLIDIMRFADDGLVHEHWGVFDAMAMMQQLNPDAD
jgi:predicted ester cyclase